MRIIKTKILPRTDMRLGRIKGCALEKYNKARLMIRFDENTENMIKTCSKCGKEYPLNNTYFFNAKNGHMNFSAHCKNCDKKSKIRFKKNRPTYAQEYHLYSTFRMTKKQYEKILFEQGGVCASCKELPKDKRLVVDHNHSCCPKIEGKHGVKTCGKCVRGLLCQPCNMLEGFIRTERYNQVKKYIKNYENKNNI